MNCFVIRRGYHASLFLTELKNVPNDVISLQILVIVTVQSQGPTVRDLQPYFTVAQTYSHRDFQFKKPSRCRDLVYSQRATVTASPVFVTVVSFHQTFSQNSFFLFFFLRLHRLLSVPDSSSGLLLNSSVTVLWGTPHTTVWTFTVRAALSSGSTSLSVFFFFCSAQT